ncbi:MAG: HIT family protein [Eubacterium sp.]|nr:HIT family protein [Eubacterium sp.]
MTKDDCIFCKLANGVFPTNSIYEDENFNVILDVSPANRGHALILPKQHFDNIFEIDDETASKIMPLAKKIATAVKKVTECDGVNVQQNNGTAAGQSVFHLHVHIIPRFDDDKFKLVWDPKSFSDEELAATAEELRAEIG